MNEQKTKVLTYTQKMILGVLSQGKLTMVELVGKVGITRSAVTANLRVLKRTGLVYANGCTPTDGRPAAFYDVHVKHPMPDPSENLGKNRKLTPRLRSILDALEENGPMTIEDLAAWVGCEAYHISSAISYYREGGNTKVLRITRWAYVPGSAKGYLPVYGRGPGGDAPKPKVDKKAYGAAWRERNRAKVRAAQAVYRQKKFGKTAVANNPFWQLVSLAGAGCAAGKQREEAEAA